MDIFKRRVISSLPMILIFLTIFGQLGSVNSQAKKNVTDPLEAFVDEYEGELNHGDSCTDPAELLKRQLNPGLDKEVKMMQLSMESCDFNKFLVCYNSTTNNRSAEDDRRGLDPDNAGVFLCGCSEHTGGNRRGMPDQDGVCRIPANMGFQSKCGPNVISRQLFTKKTLVATCTENSECMPNGHHIGMWCYCKIGFPPRGGFCGSGWRPGSDILPIMILLAVAWVTRTVFY